MKTICSNCQNEMTLGYETATHTIFKKAITVDNVPMYRCNTCPHAFYVMSEQLDWQLKEAYRRNETHIDFQS